MMPDKRETAHTPETETLTLVKGVEGNSVYLNYHRIAGPKPWGGGPVLKKWRVRRKDVETALYGPKGARADAAEALLEEARTNMQWFVDQCNSGKIRSVKTKAAFETFLDKLPERDQ